MLLRSRKLKTMKDITKEMLLYNFALPGYTFQIVPTSRDCDDALTLIAFLKKHSLNYKYLRQIPYFDSSSRTVVKHVKCVILELKNKTIWLVFTYDKILQFDKGQEQY